MFFFVTWLVSHPVTIFGAMWWMDEMCVFVCYVCNLNLFTQTNDKKKFKPINISLSNSKIGNNSERRTCCILSNAMLTLPLFSWPSFDSYVIFHLHFGIWFPVTSWHIIPERTVPLNTYEFCISSVLLFYCHHVFYPLNFVYRLLAKITFCPPHFFLSVLYLQP